MELQALGTAAAPRSSQPLIINVCLTGIVPTRTTSPHVPLSTDEIIDDAAAVLDAGASMLHIHARAADGSPTWRPEAYARIIEGIRRDHPQAVIVVTTSGRAGYRFEERAAVLDLDGDARPDMASLSLGSLNFPEGVSENSPETIQRLAARMQARGIRPELEVFDSGMLNYAHYLLRKNLLHGPCYVNLLLGVLGGASGRVIDLCRLVQDVPRDWIWAAAGIGSFQLPVHMAALAMGGHVRVGLEDNLYYDEQRRVPAGNRALVERVVRLARELERPIATAQETRALLGLASRGAQVTRLHRSQHTSS